MLPRNPHVSKKYSLDELLEQDPLSHDLAQISRPEQSHAPFPPGGVFHPRHEERRRDIGQERKGMDVGTKKRDSFFAIAKRGWQVPPLIDRGTQQGKGKVREV